MRIAGGPSRPATVAALGKSPIALIRAADGERVILTQDEEATLAAGDEIHLVVEAAVKASGMSRAWRGNPCAFRVGLSSTALLLTPLDGRQVVGLELASTAELTLGRVHEAAGSESWRWGVRDPRVSRAHARLVGGPGRPIKVHALGNPMRVVTPGGQGTIIRKGGWEPRNALEPRAAAHEPRVSPPVGEPALAALTRGPTPRPMRQLRGGQPG